MLKRRNVLRGFTLIELLVVIAVLALLLSIVMPSLAKAKEFARRTVCLAHLGQLGLICVTYAQDNNDGFPNYTGWPNRNGNPGVQSSDPRIIFDNFNADARPIWVGYVADYTIEESTDIFYCPSETGVSPEDHWTPLSYFTGYPYWGNFEFYEGSFEHMWGSVLDPPQKTTTVKTSSITPLWGDWVQYYGGAYPGPWDVTHTKKFGKSQGYMSEKAWGMNASYADGSAKWCSYEDDEFSSAMQWAASWIRFWGAPRTLEKEGFGAPEE